MRRSDHIAAEQALKTVEDTARLIETRDQIVHETMAPIHNRLDANHIDVELQYLAQDLTG